MIEPIHFQTKLDATSKNKPQYSVPVKSKSGEEILCADPNATRALIALMDMNAVLGGAACHYGGPAALAELMSATHAYMFTQAEKQNKKWTDLFHFVNDAGHCENGLYALKANYKIAGLDFQALKKFRSIESPLTGHGEVHCFPQGVFLSNGPLGSAFPQTQGLALGEKLSGRQRLTFAVISDGACMEGEAKEAFAAIPGLAKAGRLAPYVVMISDNNTKLSGRIDAESFSMQPSFEALKALGWKVIELAQGNDLQKCYTAIEEAASWAQAHPEQPVAIHAKTIKGIGTKKTAESSSGSHGFSLKSPSELKSFISEIYAAQAYPEIFDTWIDELLKLEADLKAKAVKDSGEKIQVGVSQALIKARKAGRPVISVTSDLPGSTGVAGFRKEFPEASVDVGVAESNMISTAIGLSKLGFIPVVDTFAQFGVTKGALPFIMSSLSEAPLIAIFSHTGFQDAADGASHQALSYIAMTASIPHVHVVALSCSDEAEALVTEAIHEFVKARNESRVPDSYIFFLGRENFPKSYQTGSQYKLGQAQVLFEETKSSSRAVTIATYGSSVPQALQAAHELKEKGIGSIVLNFSSLSHLDLETTKKALGKTLGRLITVEDHQWVGGLGSLLAQSLVHHGVNIQMKSLAVKGRFGQSSYTANELYALHEIDAKAVVKSAVALLGAE